MNEIATTKSRVTAEALVVALEKYYARSYTSFSSNADEAGVYHVQITGLRADLRMDWKLLDRIQEFSSGFLAAKDGDISETQGYEPNQTPMSVSPDWKSDGTGFRHD
jgi:hypothetical protein